MDDQKNLVSIVSTFAVLLILGCGIVSYLPIGTVEGSIVYLASVVGTLLVWIGRKLG